MNENIGLIGQLRSRTTWAWNQAGPEIRSELEQGVIRFGVGLVLTIILFFITILSGKMGSSDSVGLMIAGPFFLCAVGIFLWVIHAPKVSHVRRVVAMLTDVGTVTICMFVSGALASGFFAVYLWVTFANGFRFGREYLILAQIASFVGFSFVVLFNPYWRSHYNFAFSYLIALAVLPLYIGSLVEKLHQAIRKAEEASSAKSRFLANMSHELRTPVAGIIGVNELLLSTNITPDQSRLIDTQTASANALLSLIENVLDISRIEANHISIEPIDFDLYETVHTINTMLRFRAEAKGLKLACDVHYTVPFAVTADQTRIKQVLVNLVGNAIKFTERGRVDLKLTRIDETSSTARVRFEVTDTGIGISTNAQSRIFERFTQADDSTARRYGGSGLGTTISKQLVELMGGTMGVISQIGKGSTFWFELPLLKRAIVSMEDIDATSSFDSRNILLLARATVNGNQIEEYLGAWHTRIRVERDANEAIRALEEGRAIGKPFPVVVVCADGLDMDLARFAERSVAQDKASRPSLVMLSRQADANTRSYLSQHGYSGFLTFPVDKPSLFNAIHAASIATNSLEGNIVSLAKRRAMTKAKRSLRVLLAEDNPTNQMVIREVLAGAGHAVTLAVSGEDALDKIEAREFDVAIVDMNMPDVSGVDVIRAVRTTLLDRRTLPIIVLTANATSDAKAECFDAGANAFLTKPVKFPKLLETIVELTEVVDKRAASIEASPLVTSAAVVLDLAMIQELERIQTTPGFVQRILGGFVDDQETAVKMLSGYLKSHAYQAIKDYAHTLKGAASQVGALALVEFAKRLEVATIQELEANGTIWYSELQKLFGATVVEIRDYLSNNHTHETARNE